jgi:hypothetical protein
LFERHGENIWERVMTTPSNTPRNKKAMRLAILVVVALAVWFVVFR